MYYGIVTIVAVEPVLGQEKFKDLGQSTLNHSLSSHLPTYLTHHFPLLSALLYMLPYHIHPLPHSIAFPLPHLGPGPTQDETVRDKSNWSVMLRLPITL